MAKAKQHPGRAGHVILCVIFFLLFAALIIRAFSLESFSLQMAHLALALLFGFFGEAQLDRALTPKAPPQPVASPAPPRPRYAARKAFVGDLPVSYAYLRPILPAEGVDLSAELKGEELEAELESDGHTVTLVKDGKALAVVPDTSLARMVEDFEENGDPCLAYILETGTEAQLRFYCDRREKLGEREQTVDELLGYKNDIAQMLVGLCTPGEPVDIDEDTGAVSLALTGGEIGKVRKSVLRRVTQDGFAAAFFEEAREDFVLTSDHKNEELLAPKIRIYW